METSVANRPWLKAEITGDIDAIQGVRVAFLLHAGKPVDADWHAAELVGGDVRILIGTGGGAHTLAPATYRMWVELDAPPELIREPAGIVSITP